MQGESCKYWLEQVGSTFRSKFRLSLMSVSDTYPYPPNTPSYVAACLSQYSTALRYHIVCVPSASFSLAHNDSASNFCGPAHTKLIQSAECIPILYKPVCMQHKKSEQNARALTSPLESEPTTTIAISPGNLCLAGTRAPGRTKWWT